MAATARQFVEESYRLLRPLGLIHRDSRSTFKEAAERLSVKKMPRATETDRKKFVSFALKLYDRGMFERVLDAGPPPGGASGPSRSPRGPVRFWRAP